MILEETIEEEQNWRTIVAQLLQRFVVDVLMFIGEEKKLGSWCAYFTWKLELVSNILRMIEEETIEEEQNLCTIVAQLLERFVIGVFMFVCKEKKLGYWKMKRKRY